MTTMLTTRLSHDAEQLLLAVDALFPEDAERLRGWVGRRIANGDFEGRAIDGKLLRNAASKWPDPLFKQVLESAARFLHRDDALLSRFRRAVA